MRRLCLVAIVLALPGSHVAWSGDTVPSASRPTGGLEAACIRLIGECKAARVAAGRDPMVVEEPPGVFFKTTSPAATRHVVNAIAIARAIRQQYGALPPACAHACDDLLKLGLRR